MKQAKIERLTNYYMGQEGMTQRKLVNRLKKEEQKEQAERGQKSVKEISITVEWKRSATWGNCPQATASIRYESGAYSTLETRTITGCGYDKESTAVAELLNQTLKYKLWEREDQDNSKAPYGIRLDFNYNPYFEGGVGVSCYYDIAKFLGGEMKHTASGKKFDVYTITMGGNK